VSSAANENPWIDICPGIRRRTVTHGETMYQMIAELKAGSKMPEHKHPQEQIIHILSGRMTVFANGGAHELRAGAKVAAGHPEAGEARRGTSHAVNRFRATERVYVALRLT